MNETLKTINEAIGKRSKFIRTNSNKDSGKNTVNRNVLLNQ